MGCHGPERRLPIMLPGDGSPALHVGDEIGIEQDLEEFGLAEAWVCLRSLGNVEDQFLKLLPVDGRHRYPSSNVLACFSVAIRDQSSPGESGPDTWTSECAAVFANPDR